MATLLIKATELSVGDVMVLPFNRTATIEAIKAVGPRTQYVKFLTEFGWSRIGVHDQVHVQARVI